MIKKNIVLKSVSKSDEVFLYELLSQRNLNVNISHKEMPSFNEHVKFINLKPYSKWYIILFNNIKCGSIYLSKQNEIGIFLKIDMQGKGIGKKAIDILKEKNPRSRYLANINPKNKKSIKFFKEKGFKLIQHTYELNKE